MSKLSLSFERSRPSAVAVNTGFNFGHMIGELQTHRRTIAIFIRENISYYAYFPLSTIFYPTNDNGVLNRISTIHNV